MKCTAHGNAGARNGNYKHGQTDSPAFHSWVSARRRCEETHHHHYPRYGGRGIRFCDRWKSFENFLEDMGPRPPGTTLDRKDNDGHYEPGNCRWATHKEQGSNRGNNRILELKGRRMTVAQWARETGITYVALNARINVHHWTVERALTTPLTVRSRRA